MRDIHDSLMFSTSACPATAPTLGLAKCCTRMRRASGSSIESESTNAMISASVARMPAAIAARLPRFSGKLDHPDAAAGVALDLAHLDQRAVGRAVVDGHELELVGRVVELQQRPQRLRDRLLLVEARHDDRHARLDPVVLPRAVEEAQQEARQDVDRDAQPVDGEERIADQELDEERLVDDDPGDDRQQVGERERPQALLDRQRKRAAARRLSRLVELPGLGHQSEKTSWPSDDSMLYVQSRIRGQSASQP